MSNSLPQDCMIRRLRLARENAGLSQTQAAAILEMRRPSVVEIEKGRRRVSADELKRFSDIYKVPLAWLACAETEDSDEERERIELAARELSKLRKEDLDRVLDLLSAFRGDSSA